MRHLADELGDRARYLRADTYREALEQVGRPVLVHEPTSHAAADLVERLRKEGLVAEVLPTPTFALSRAEFAEWAGERERVPDGGVLPGPAAPVRRADGRRASRSAASGTTTTTTASRRPRGAERARRAGAVAAGPRTRSTSEVRADLDAMELPTVGRDGPRWFAVTADEAQQALRALRRATAAALRPVRGRHADRRTGRWRTRCCRCRSTWACCTRWTPCARPRRPTAAGAVPLRQRGGLHPAGAGLAGVHLAALLALRAGLPAAQRAAGTHPAAGLVA